MPTTSYAYYRSHTALDIAIADLPSPPHTLTEWLGGGERIITSGLTERAANALRRKGYAAFALKHLDLARDELRRYEVLPITPAAEIAPPVTPDQLAALRVN